MQYPFAFKNNTLGPLKDIKEKIVLVWAVLNVDLL